MLSERLLRELEALRARFAELEVYAKSLEHELSRHATENAEEVRAMKEELGHRVQENQQQHLELRQTAADLAAKHAFIDDLLQRLHILETEARTRTSELESTQSRGIELAQELSSIKEELGRRLKELEQKHLELRHTKADVAVKQAFVDDLRQQLGSVLDDVAVKQALIEDLRQQLGSVLDDVAVKQALIEDLRQKLGSIKILHSRLAALETEVNALRVYQNSACFRLMERAIAALKRIPVAYALARRLARALASGSGIAS